MRGFKLIAIAVGALFILFLTLLIIEINRRSSLENSMFDGVSKVAEGKGAQAKVKQLEKEIALYKQEALSLQEKIPKGERAPIQLIKELTIIGKKRNFKKL